MKRGEMMEIAPSILASDFSNLESEVKKIEKGGADYVHLDVMDGMFVPNITFGAPVIKSIRKHTTLPFDVHLMINNPGRYIDDFADAGADIITIHAEAEKNISETIQKIKSKGVKCGISIKPKTAPELIFDHIKEVDLILVMTVEPGFGGQVFMVDMMEKVDRLKEWAKAVNPSIKIEIDGGVNRETAKIAKAHGVDICVAGTSVFSADDIEKAIFELR